MNKKTEKETKVATANQTKLAVFEEDDFFEEFDEEDYDGGVKEDIDYSKWQEEWEDEEINDGFETVLRREMELFKTSNNVSKINSK